MSEIAKTIEELKERENLSEQELIALGLGIVPAVNDYTSFQYNKTREIQLKDGSLMDYRYDHILEWFNNEVYDRTINLSPEDKDRYFQMITDYHDILQKLANDHNNIIWEFAAGNPPSIAFFAKITCEVSPSSFASMYFLASTVDVFVMSLNHSFLVGLPAKYFSFGFMLS